MSDIFVSYASADRDRARAIAEALAEHGWSVWWDRTIPPGKQFDEVIEEALDSARCVVVLWSSASVASQWVKTEAADAMRRKILVPALIEDVKIPLEFRRLQAADLSRWPEEHPPELKEFFQSIASHVGRVGQGPSVSSHAIVTSPSPSRPVEVPPEPARPARASPGAATILKRRGVALVVAGVAAIVALVGYGVHTDYSRRLAREAAESRRAAEDERRAAEDVRRKADEQRREAEEATARAKTALANAEREEAARRKAEEDRRAAAAATSAKTAQEKTKREETARRKAEDEVARLKAEQETTARERAGTPSAPRSLNLRWRDNALAYTGTLSWTPGNANIRATVSDLTTGLRIGDYDVPAHVSRVNATDYVVSADFAVPADSITRFPHSHTAGLVLRANQNGALYFMRNCPPVQRGAVRQGECY